MVELSVHRIVEIKVNDYKKLSNELGEYYYLGLDLIDKDGIKTEITMFSNSVDIENGEEGSFDLKFEFPELEIDNKSLYKK